MAYGNRRSYGGRGGYGSRPKGNCYKCGRSGHWAKNCYVRRGGYGR